MKPSESADKVLDLLHVFSSHKGRALSLHELSTLSSIPKATLLRILASLMERHLVMRQPDKTYFGHFLFHQLLPVSDEIFHRIQATLKNLQLETQQVTEFLCRQGTNLYWISSFETEDMAIRVKAKPGTLRTLYELDSPSRLYLAGTTDRIREQVMAYPHFLKMDGTLKGIKLEEAKSLIASVKPQEVEYDEDGNKNGIRRFSILFQHADMHEPCVLCIAEAAIKKDKAHFLKMKNLLQQAKKNIEGI